MSYSSFFLIGMPGSGKTTFGKQLAAELELPFFDLDVEIEKEIGKKITEIFKDQGESVFREIESEKLIETIASNDKFILATGGGTPCFGNNLEKMDEHGLTIYLNTSIEEIKNRLANDQTRPLLQKQSIESLFKEREVCYSKATSHVTSYNELSELIRNSIQK